jgi:hypothetical protein
MLPKKIPRFTSFAEKSSEYTYPLDITPYTTILPEMPFFVKHFFHHRKDFLRGHIFSLTGHVESVSLL